MNVLDHGNSAGGRRRTGAAAELVYERLRENVISLKLPPETSLSRNALCKRFSVSQTPVREAILRLEKEGLVKSYPQSRTVVTRINVAQVREAHFLRSALEIEIARRLAAARDPHAVDDAARVLDAQTAVGTSNSAQPEFARLDRVFHESLYAASGQTGLAELVRERSGHLDRLRRLHLPSPGKTTKILAEHGEILAAIRSGDPSNAEAAVRRHLTGTISTIEELIAGAPDYFDAPQEAG